MNPLEILELDAWDPPAASVARAADALESGKVLFLPRLRFNLDADETRFLSPDWSNGKAKNISYDPVRARVSGTDAPDADRAAIAAMMGRYARQARALVERISPRYASRLLIGRTSFRPVEITGRASSVTKDDTRLHVDAFVSQPVQGKRILRVFSNVHPGGRPRTWEVGDGFEYLLPRFLPNIPQPLPGSAWLLHRLGITKSRRSRYDHIMLHLHDAMKRGVDYQRETAKTRLEFPAGSTWAVFTDQVPHAALAGQFVFEQTFYVPVDAMRNEQFAPLRILEQQLHMQLV